MMRAKSDFGPRHQHYEQPKPRPVTPQDDAGSSDGFKMRHGWDDQLTSEERNNILTSVRCAQAN